MATRKHNHHRRTRASVARTESKTLKLFNHQSSNHQSNHRMLKNVSLHSVSKDIMSQQNKFQKKLEEIIKSYKEVHRKPLDFKTFLTTLARSKSFLKRLKNGEGAARIPFQSLEAAFEAAGMDMTLYDTQQLLKYIVGLSLQDSAGGGESDKSTDASKIICGVIGVVGGSNYYVRRDLLYHFCLDRTKKYVKFKDPSFVAKDAVIDLLPTRHYECKLLNRFIDNYFIDPDDTNETPLNSSTKFLTQKVLYEFIQKHSDAFPGLLTGLTRHVLIEAGIEATNEAEFEEYHLNRHKFTRQRTIKNRTDTANSNASNVNHNFVESQKNMNHNNNNNNNTNRKMKGKSRDKYFNKKRNNILKSQNTHSNNNDSVSIDVNTIDGANESYNNNDGSKRNMSTVDMIRKQLFQSLLIGIIICLDIAGAYYFQNSFSVEVSLSYVYIALINLGVFALWYIAYTGVIITRCIIQLCCARFGNNVANDDDWYDDDDDGDDDNNDRSSTSSNKQESNKVRYTFGMTEEADGRRKRMLKLPSTDANIVAKLLRFRRSSSFSTVMSSQLDVADDRNPSRFTRSICTIDLSKRQLTKAMYTFTWIKADSVERGDKEALSKLQITSSTTIDVSGDLVFNLHFDNDESIYCKALNPKDYMRWLSALEPMVGHDGSPNRNKDNKDYYNGRNNDSDLSIDSLGVSSAFASPSSYKEDENGVEFGRKPKLQRSISHSVSKISTDFISRTNKKNFIAREPSNSVALDKNGSFNVDAEIRQREARQRQKKQEQEEEERRQREEREKQQEQNFHLHTADTADLHKVSTSEILSTDNIDLNTSPSRGDSTYEIYQPANSPSLSKQSSSYNNQSFKSSDNGSQGVDLADEISILDDMLGLYDDDDDD